jgi:hypothetical protein
LFPFAVSWSRKNRDFALWNYLDIFGEELLQLLQVIEEKTMKKLKEVRPQGVRKVLAVVGKLKRRITHLLYVPKTAITVNHKSPLQTYPSPL